MVDILGPLRQSDDESPASIRKAEIRADLLKWVVGSVALTLITTVGNWTFQYFSLRAEAEKTNRELKIKEKEMQLQYLDKFTQTAIDQDITKRIRLAHYISSTIDDKEYQQLAKKWLGYYDNLVGACKDRLRTAAGGRQESPQAPSEERECTIGGTFRIASPTTTATVPIVLEPSEAGGGGVLGDLIARGESGKISYGAFNRGVPGEPGGRDMDFSAMTIAEIMALQALPRGDPKRLFGVGKYLLIPVTVKAAVAALKLEESTKFTPSVQEKLFRNYLIAIRRPAIKNFITGVTEGEAGLFSAQVALSLDFASVARPDSGQSNYGGSRVITTKEQTALALQEERAAYQQNISKGLSADAAWEALSPAIDTKPVAETKPKP